MQGPECVFAPGLGRERDVLKSFLQDSIDRNAGGFAVVRKGPRKSQFVSLNPAYVLPVPGSHTFVPSDVRVPSLRDGMTLAAFMCGAI